MDEVDVEPDPSARSADPSLVRKAASTAGFAVGLARDAIVCTPDMCRVVGVYRGMVQIVRYQEIDADSLAVTLLIVGLELTGEIVGSRYVVIDEVHVVRTSDESAWRIEKVIRLLES
jgi:hypothetical protein